MRGGRAGAYRIRSYAGLILRGSRVSSGLEGCSTGRAFWSVVRACFAAPRDKRRKRQTSKDPASMRPRLEAWRRGRTAGAMEPTARPPHSQAGAAANSSRRPEIASTRRRTSFMIASGRLRLAGFLALEALATTLGGADPGAQGDRLRRIAASARIGKGSKHEPGDLRGDRARRRLGL